MEPIKNTGVEYPMAMPQNQNMQEYDDYASIPMTYDPEIEQKKKASSNMLGMTILGLTTAALGYAAGKHLGSKGLKDAQLVADEALKNYEKSVKLAEELKKGKEEADKALGEYRTMGRWKRFCSWLRPSSQLSETEAEARKAAIKAKNEAAKAEKAAKKEGKNVEKTVKETTEKKPEKTED